MKTILALFSKYKYLIIVVLICSVTVVDLFNYGLPPTHDAEYHVLRFWQFYKVLSDGIFYPRWAPDFNNAFGIPLFTYVYPLPNYVASIFHLFGLSFIDSFKASMIFATIIGSIFFYLWSRKFWGELGAVVSSVFYAFSPYHLLDIYVRGSIGEVWALALFPGLLWSFTTYLEKRRYKYFIISCLFLSAVIYSHNILALMFFGFFLAYAIVLIYRTKKFKEKLIDLFLVVLISLGLSAPFWLPALFEKSLVTGLQIFDVTSSFTPIYKFFVPTWGFGLSPFDPLNPMSVQIGYANLLAIIFSFFSFYALRGKRMLIGFFISSFVLVFFLMTSYSTILWKIVPFLSYFQFPWRLLSLEIVICSFLAGSFVYVFNKSMKVEIVLSIFLVLLTVILSIHYIKAPFYHKRGDNHYLTRSNFTDGTNSPGNVFNTMWLVSIPPKEKNKLEVVKGNGKIDNQLLKASEYTFVIQGKNDLRILINTAYFPGWTAYVDEKRVEVNNYKGRMVVDTPKGKHDVRIILQNTLTQNLSYVYFLLSVLLIIYLKPYISKTRKK